LQEAALRREFSHSAAASKREHQLQVETVQIGQILSQRMIELGFETDIGVEIVSGAE
jgi:Fe2+ transport system protein FeoA